MLEGQRYLSICLSSCESFDEVMSCSDIYSWFTTVQEELKSKDDNDVSELVSLPNDFHQLIVNGSLRPREIKSKVEPLKAKLFVKRFSQQKEIDFNDTFCLYLTKIISEYYRFSSSF